ncbi:GPI-anchored protein PB15E9.01c, partial [Biomphalaria glabrata]
SPPVELETTVITMSSESSSLRTSLFTQYTFSSTPSESITASPTLQHPASSSFTTTNNVVDVNNTVSVLTQSAPTSSITNTVTDSSNSFAALTINTAINSIAPTFTVLDTTNLVTTLTSQTASIDMATYTWTSVVATSITVTTTDITPAVSDVTFSATVSTTHASDFSQTITPVSPIVIKDTILELTNKTVKCPCNCLNKLIELIQQNLTTLSKARKLEIIQTLLLKRSTLSSYRREKTSAENVEKSEQYIGSTFGVVTVCIVIVVIVLCDLVIFTKFLCPYLSVIKKVTR